MTRKSRYASLKRDKDIALRAFHKDVSAKAATLTAHSFFEIVCKAPDILSIRDVEQYAIDWIDRGWSADVVAHYFDNGRGGVSLRLRSYVDSIPY